MTKLSILIPCYNEEKTILQVIEALLALDLNNIGKEIIIINDGSTDNTQLLLNNLNNPQITVIRHEFNQGKTAAIKTGLNSATGDYVIIQDADLEYDVADIKKILQAALAENLPAVYGSRRLNKTNHYSYLTYYLGANFLTALSNLLYKQNLTDIETCYKLIKTDLLKDISIDSARFAFENEITAKLANLGIKIKEVPIAYHARTKKQGKKIKFRHGLEALFTTFKYWRLKNNGQFFLFDKLLQYLRFQKVKKIIQPQTTLLDLGCGYNFKLYDYLKNLNPKYYGLDMQINQLNSSPEANLIQYNFDTDTALPFKDDFFDYVLSLANLEHLINFQNNLREIYRILKPGGCLLITTPTKFAKPFLELLAALHIINSKEITDHKQYFTTDSLLNALTQAGFATQNISHQYWQFGCNHFIIAKK